MEMRPEMAASSFYSYNLALMLFLNFSRSGSLTHINRKKAKPKIVKDAIAKASLKLMVFVRLKRTPMAVISPKTTPIPYKAIALPLYFLST